MKYACIAAGMTQWTLIALAGFLDYFAHCNPPSSSRRFAYKPSLWVMFPFGYSSKENTRARQLLRVQSFKDTLCSSHMFVPLNIQMPHIQERFLPISDEKIIYGTKISDLWILHANFNRRPSVDSEGGEVWKRQCTAVFKYELPHWHFDTQRGTYPCCVFLACMFVNALDKAAAHSLASCIFVVLLACVLDTGIWKVDRHAYMDVYCL